MFENAHLRKSIVLNIYSVPVMQGKEDQIVIKLQKKIVQVSFHNFASFFIKYFDR